MKICKQIFALLFCLVMVVGLLIGCDKSKGSSSDTSTTSSGGDSSADTSSSPDEIPLVGNGNTYASGLPIVKERETLKIAVVRHTLDKSNGFNEKAAFIKAAEETNIDIEWIELVSGTQSDRVSIMLASDLPDIFLGLLSESAVAKNKDSLVSLYDLVQEYGPNIVRDYKKIGEQITTASDGWDLVKMPNGKVYTLMTKFLSNYQNHADGVQFINQKWLEKSGKNMPTNIDEFYDVLVAFKNGDPNDNGKNDEIPLEFCNNNWAAVFHNFAGPWGIAGRDEAYYYKIVDGVVNTTIDTSEYRSFLEYYHKLAKEDLLDVEGFSQTNQQFYAKLKEYICGSYYGWTPQSNLDSETAKEYVLLPPMYVPGMEGQQLTSGIKNKINAGRTGFAITTACKNPIAAIRWWDYLSSSAEMKLTVAYGEEGKLWEKDGKGGFLEIYPETITDDFTRENMKYTWGLVNEMPVVLIDETPYSDPEKYPESVVRNKFVTGVQDFFPKENAPTRFVDEAKVQERAFIQTDLREYIKNFESNSVINGVTDESWKEHLKQLKEYKYYEWILWYQDFVAGKF